LGTNHNYFNTEWTPGLSAAPSRDDWYDESDTVCGSKSGKLRLKPKEQQAVGAAYTAALVKLAVRQDADMLPLLDGSYVRPTSIGRADVAVNTVGGAKNRFLYRPGFKVTTRFRNGMQGQECTSRYQDPFTDVNAPLATCADGNAFAAPHWITRSFRVFAQALELSWRQGKQANVEFQVPTSQSNFTGLDWVNVRIINDPDKAGASFRLVVRDKAGNNATLSSNLTTIDGWPGQDNLDRYQARSLRGNLGSVRSSINLDQVVAISLVAQSTSGRVWVLDVAAGQAKVQRPIVLDLPVLSVESKSVLETDGLKQYNLRILADRPLKAPGTIWVQEGTFGSDSGYLLELSPGPDKVAGEIVYDVVGDDVFSNSSIPYSVRIDAVNGVIGGESYGLLSIAEDDPAPKLSVAPLVSTAVEGESLQWTLTLSSPTAGGTMYFTAIAPAKAEELVFSDIPISWWKSKDFFIPTTSSKLSDLFLAIPVRFEYGATTATLRIPLAKDGKAEGEKVVVLQSLSGFEFGLNFAAVTMIGKVPANK
jgi:hypothetical protein